LAQAVPPSPRVLGLSARFPRASASVAHSPVPMDERLFECAVCLEVCQQCINCLQCNQILCGRHVGDLHDDRCPVCRASPFRFQENVALQRIIAELNRRAGRLEEPPASTRGRFAPEGGAAVAPSGGAAPEETVSEAARAVHPRFGSKVPCAGRLGGQFMKLPSEEHAVSMRAHVRHCTHAGCRTVWSGPWGSFIGGDRGQTLFDLTDCREGRRLNQLIGWDYQDPVC